MRADGTWKNIGGMK
ncbi:hypothetical protein [Escherichia coli]